MGLLKEEEISRSFDNLVSRTQIPVYNLDCKKRWNYEWWYWSDADIVYYQVILCPSVHHRIPRFFHRFTSVRLSWACILIIRLIISSPKGLMDQFRRLIGGLLCRVIILLLAHIAVLVASLQITDQSQGSKNLEGDCAPHCLQSVT